MNLIRLAIVTTSLVFSSCIEFERQEISHIHDDDKDELRLTLVYQGIFGSLKEGFESKKKDAEDLPHHLSNDHESDRPGKFHKGGEAS